MNPIKTVNAGVWVVKESIALSSLTIAEGASVAAPEDKSVTMTVDGVGTALTPGTYTGDIFLTVTDRYMVQPGGLMAKGKPVEFRCAIVIEDGKYIKEKSVPAIVQGGKVTNNATTGVTIYGCEENFNGILVTGDSEYTIDGATINFEGDGGNDFIGYGAGITALGNAKLTVNNSDVHLKGVTRCTFHAGGKSVTTLNNCNLYNDSPATTKMNPLWALGLSGTNRATQLVDYAHVYYNNCHIYGNGWGSLSIDGGVQVRMFLKDSTIDLVGPRARGYGAFSIGDAFISYDHCTLNVQGYPLLIGGGAGMPGNQKSDGEFTNGTVVNSTLYGAMVFRCDGTELKVNKGTVFNTGSSVFVLKGCNASIDVDDAKLNPANGVILQLMDNDEPGMGPARFIVPLGLDEPIPGRDLTKANPKEDVFMTVSNTDISGDFYNSTTNLKANCVEKVQMLRDGGPPGGMKMDTTAQQGAKNLDVKFVNAKIKGVISAATAAYRDGVRIIDASNYKELSAITQTAREPVNNGVIASFDKDSVWTVTGTSYLTGLTIAKGATVKAPAGKKLTITIDGVKTKIAAGTYKGNIVLTVA